MMKYVIRLLYSVAVVLVIAVVIYHNSGMPMLNLFLMVAAAFACFGIGRFLELRQNKK